MNAIFRDDCEAIVLTNEAIEVHLSYLRPAVEALGDKLDAVNKKIDQRVGELDSKLDRRVDGLNVKIDQHNKEHIERASKIQASLEGLKWFVSSATVLATGVSIAHSLGWI
jgi:hypothetical protein